MHAYVKEAYVLPPTHTHTHTHAHTYTHTTHTHTHTHTHTTHTHTHTYTHTHTHTHTIQHCLTLSCPFTQDVVTSFFPLHKLDMQPHYGTHTHTNQLSHSPTPLSLKVSFVPFLFPLYRC